ncbi:MAG: sugar dehydratase, partial [Betaproteobacteria bacterium]|nr:sugar dehydratase [Betaproteobacteria bacterium]
AEAVRPGLSNLGAVNMYTREVANHVVTVVGEAPSVSLQRIGNTVEYRRPQ